MRVAGEGEQGTGGASPAISYLRVHLAPDSEFERKGQDLYTKVRVPVTTAVLGGEAEVPNLGGKPLRLKIPPTTQNGQVFRLKGHGMPLVGKTGRARRSVCNRRSRAAPRADAGGARALRGARETGDWQEELGR